MKLFTLILCLAAGVAVGCKKQPSAQGKDGAMPGQPAPAAVVAVSADDKNVVLPGRHMSESQVMDIAFKELPQGSRLQCEFKEGVWDVLEVQAAVWGVASVVTNADGKVLVTSTNATRLVLRVRDADGKAEQVKTP